MDVNKNLKFYKHSDFLTYN